MSVECVEDEPCPGSTAVLEAAAQEAGLELETVSTREAFVAGLRSGRHAGYVVCDEPPEDTALVELRERVRAGPGLLWLKPTPDEEPELRELTGVHVRGEMPGEHEVEEHDEEEHTGLTTHDPVELQPLAGATLLTVQREGRTVVVGVRNRFGAGNVTTLGFDPERSDTAEMRAMLAETLRTLTPASAPPLVPGDEVALRFTVHNDSPGPREVTLTLANSQVSWLGETTFATMLAAGESRVFDARLRLPDAAGTFTMSGDLRWSHGAQEGLATTAAVSVVVDASEPMLRAEAIGRLQALSLRASDATRRRKALEELAKLDGPGEETKGLAEDRLESTAEAIETTLDIEQAETAEIVEVLGRLLATWERRWTVWP